MCIYDASDFELGLRPNIKSGLSVVTRKLVAICSYC